MPASAYGAAGRLLSVVAWSLAVGAAAGQTPAAQPPPAPAFEVASVKENTSGSLQSNFTTTPGRLTAVNVSLYQLISVAYNGAPMPLGTLERVPAWGVSAHFDVIATTTGGQVSPDDMRAMLRELLADRFRLRIRQETRERPVYVLVLARKDGVLGPRLRRGTDDCGGNAAAEASRANRADGAMRPCQLRTFPGQMTGRAVTLEALAKALVSAVEDHREVRDGTGLDGRFDLDLEWTPDTAVVNLRPPDAPPLPAIDPSAPALTTALREQLGLRLDTQKVSATVWVIDEVQRPDTN
jgi:uncharacterized protein (TIGR03435 family)